MKTQKQQCFAKYMIDKDQIATILKAIEMRIMKIEI
jgi:hypothetical protein